MNLSSVIFATFCLTIALSEGKPAADIDSKNTNANNYEYYADGEDYEYSSDDDYLSEDEHVIHTIPEFRSKATDQLVNEGETIKLPCIVDKLESYVIIWKKGKDILSVGEQLINKRESRVKLMSAPDGNGNTIVISLAEEKDEGEYTCQISANKPTNLRHQVRIRVEPRIEVEPRNGVLIVKEGEPANLRCNVVKGKPAPEVIWRRKERKLPSGQDAIRGSDVTFTPATRHHSGIYYCEASNGFSKEPVRATIKLDVQHAPTVEAEQTFIHTRENDETEVVCVVHASPKAAVTWYKNGKPLLRSEGIVSARGNRHTLLLPGIRQSTFGQYACKATNKFGSDERTTEVSGRASPANVKSPELSADETVYTLEWVTESITPVKAFKLQYRPEGKASWSNEMLVTSPLDNGDHFFAGKFKFEKLQSASNYEVRIASENDYGFNQFSEPFTFGTKGAAPIQQPSTTTKGDASKSATLSSSLFLATLICLWFTNNRQN